MILLGSNFGTLETRTFFLFKFGNFQIYPSELESQPEFNGFREWLLPFELYRGKKTGEEFEDDSRVVGIFKVRT